MKHLLLLLMTITSLCAKNVEGTRKIKQSELPEEILKIVKSPVGPGGTQASLDCARSYISLTLRINKEIHTTFISILGSKGEGNKEIIYIQGEKDYYAVRIQDFSKKSRPKLKVALKALATHRKKRLELVKEIEVYLKKNPKRAKLKKALTMGVPSIGMNAKEVIYSLGEPTKINTTTTKDSVSEQWVYRLHSDTRYIYLKNGIVTTIQD